MYVQSGICFPKLNGKRDERMCGMRNQAEEKEGRKTIEKHHPSEIVLQKLRRVSLILDFPHLLLYIMNPPWFYLYSSISQMASKSFAFPIRRFGYRIRRNRQARTRWYLRGPTAPGHLATVAVSSLRATIPASRSPSAFSQSTAQEASTPRYSYEGHTYRVLLRISLP